MVLQHVFRNASAINRKVSDNYPLLRNIYMGDVKTLQRLLDSNSTHTFHIPGRHGNNLLHCALAANIYEPNLIEEILCKNPSLINSKNKSGDTPLHQAVQYCDNLDILKLLLRLGAYINAVNGSKLTPLHIAAHYRSNPELFKLLLDHGADINAQNWSKLTPLHLAVSNPNIKEEDICFLLDRGANAKAVDSENNSVLNLALKNESFSLNVIKNILDHGGSPTFKDFQEETRLEYLKLILQYLAIKRFEKTFSSIKEFTPLTFERDIFDLGNDRNFCTYFYVGEFGKTCLAELIKMKKDKISDNYSLFNFIYNGCCDKNSFATNLLTVMDALLRIKNGNYVACKDIIHSSLKCYNLSLLLSELDIYTSIKYDSSNEYKISLNYYSKLKLLSYLSNDDLVNLGLVFISKSATKYPSKFAEVSSISTKRIVENELESIRLIKRLKI